MKAQKNLVFGGDGLIGRALIQELRQQGEDASSFDLKRGYDLRVQQPEPESGNTYCWFLAWDVGGAKYIMGDEYQRQILRNNVDLCSAVFSWIEQVQIPFTFVGTQMAGYPNAYGISKLLGQHWAGQFPNGLICRLWNVYGAEPVSERSHVVSDFAAQALMEARIAMRTSGTERRQFITSRDCARALLHQRKVRQKMADITSGRWITIRSIADEISAQVGATVTPGDKAGYESIVDPEFPLLGWHAEQTIASGISDVIAEMRTMVSAEPAHNG